MVCFENIVVLAPMVRVGTLSTRLLALQYGADLVYGEEIIDFKIINSERIENTRFGTIDFVGKDGRLVFRTCEKERGKVVFQVGTADPERAVQALKKVEKDITVFDVNMGCPKSFSVQGGMGSALLTQPQKIHDILTALVKNSSIPITCKIRILPNMEDTLALVKVIQETGVAALAVHGRLATQKSSEPANYDAIKKIKEIIKIPLIANGGSLDVKSYEDIEIFKQRTGADSIMLARAAQWNLSVFRKEGLLPITDVVKAYLRVVFKYAIDSIDSEGNIKYVITRMQHPDYNSVIVQQTFTSATLAELCKIWDMDEELRQTVNDYVTIEGNRKRTIEIEAPETEDRPEGTAKRFKTLTEMDLKVDRKGLSAGNAKHILKQYCVDNILEGPDYEIEEIKQTRYYRCTVMVDGQFYRSSASFISKKFAEQAAAVVCLFTLGVPFDGAKDLLTLRDKFNT